jgi:hypothetical protein
MKISTEKVPPEARWATSGQGLSAALMVTNKALYDAVGKEKYEEIVGQIWAEAGKASKQIADAFGLTGDDVKAVTETWALVTTVLMGPEFKFETAEATAEKAVLRASECPLWNRVKELEISDDLLTVGDFNYCNELTKSLNPNVAVCHTKHMHLGDPYCEWVFERKK